MKSKYLSAFIFSFLIGSFFAAMVIIADSHFHNGIRLEKNCYYIVCFDRKNDSVSEKEYNHIQVVAFNDSLVFAKYPNDNKINTYNIDSFTKSIVVK